MPQWLTNPLSLLTDFFSLGLLIAFLLLLLFIHFVIRGWAAKGVAKKLSNEAVYGDVSNAFMKSTRPWTSILKSGPVGWSKRVSGKLFAIRNDVDQFVQKLNDNFSRPDGDNS